MDSIPPIFSSSPPPFEENSHDDDEEEDQFSNFGKVSVLDDKFDPDFPEDILKSNINLPVHSTFNHEVKLQIHDDLNNQSEASENISLKFSTNTTDNEELSLNSNYDIVRSRPSIDFSSGIPSKASSESNSERIEDFGPEVLLSDNSVLNINEKQTANGIVIQPFDVDLVIDPSNAEAQASLNSALFKDKNSNVLSDYVSDQFENSDLGVSGVIPDQIVTSTEVLLEGSKEEREIFIEPDEKIVSMSEEATKSVLPNLPDGYKTEISVDQKEPTAQKAQDRSTDFEEYFDTRSYVLKPEVSAAKLYTSEHVEDFENFATFDVFTQTKPAMNFTDGDFDDFGDFVEVSEVTPERTNPKPQGQLSPIPLVPSACVKLLESVFPEESCIIKAEDSKNIDLFSDSDQISFFDKVTDFDHGSGLTVKWSWSDSQFGRSILEFVGIDPKNVIKSDKGFIYVPDFASDLSFSPLKPERMAFPVDQVAKKSQTPTGSKETVLMSSESSKLSPSVQSQPHRSLPLNLNPGKLPKEPDSDDAEKMYKLDKSVDIDYFLSLPTISSMLPQAVQRSNRAKMLSEESKRIVYLIPNLSYMTSSQLCFPASNEAINSDQSLI